jgi:carbon starvation protein CstA
MEIMADKNEWGSNLSFILAMIGSAVGLGNIWRYPYVLYSNGGGAFYIPYIVAILLMGIPFLILEYGVGYNFKSSFAKAITKIDSKWQYLGWLLPVAVFMIMIYYSAILGWDGIYMILSFTKGWGADPNTFFTANLLQASSSYTGLMNFIPVIAVAMLVGWVIIWLISHRDLEAGLGKVSKILVPALFIIMIIIMIGGLFMHPGYTIPEFTTQGLYLTDKPIFPYLFVTIACGAISGFHASQSPIVARCMETEEDARPVFFGSMVLEGIVALCWAAIALAFFHGQPQLAAIYGATPTVGVHEMATKLVGPIGVLLVTIGVVICPITSGDTALRSARITIADELKINQKKLISRMKIAIPLFLVAYGLTFVDFSLLWRYVALAQLIVSTTVLLSATVYLIKNEKHYIITLLPSIVCILITFGHILQAPECLGLPSMIANVIAAIATVIFTAAFLRKFKK